MPGIRVWTCRTSDHLLAHVPPLGWAHILLTGEYLWPKDASAEGVISPSAGTGPFGLAPAESARATKLRDQRPENGGLVTANRSCIAVTAT